MLRLRLQFRRYRLPFKTTVRTGHGPWLERGGLLLRLDDASEGAPAATGCGEAAPIPWFGTETVDEAEEGARAIGEWIEGEALDGIPARLGCLRNAIASARNDLDLARSRATGQEPVEKLAPYLSVAALLPAGKAAIGQIAARTEIGFRVFKWKVGVGDLADELALLDDVCAALPNGGKLRLDANGAWDRRQAERWLERCADRPIEFVEQPCFANASEGTARQRRTEDILLGLAGDYPTPIALDESLSSDGDAERWLANGWPGVFVVKPSLLGDVAGTLAKLANAKAHVAFSSALETAVGAKAALRSALAWTGEARAVGFGVYPLFADVRNDGPMALTFFRAEDITAIDAERTWNALS